MSRSPSFSTSFSDSLPYQLAAYPHASCIGIELGLLANPIMAPDSMKVVSHALLKLSHFPRDYLP